MASSDFDDYRAKVNEYVEAHKSQLAINKLLHNELISIDVRNSLDTKQVLTVVERYSQALDLLDAYDHQNMMRPKGNRATYILTYEECRKVIDSMKFGDSSLLFGNKRHR